MMMTLIVVLVVSGALIAGAAWGIFGRLGDRVQGFLIALAGGSLVLSLVSELIEPSIHSVHHLLSPVAPNHPMNGPQSS